jgi:hypothetical protein
MPISKKPFDFVTAILQYLVSMTLLVIIAYFLCMLIGNFSYMGKFFRSAAQPVISISIVSPFLSASFNREITLKQVSVYFIFVIAINTFLQIIYFGFIQKSSSEISFSNLNKSFFGIIATWIIVLFLIHKKNNKKI